MFAYLLAVLHAQLLAQEPQQLDVLRLLLCEGQVVVDSPFASMVGRILEVDLAHADLKAVDACDKTVILLSAFPMVVPSLSW